MSVLVRKLRWRVLRGAHWFDLIEEGSKDAAPVYVGLIDGREVMRLGERREAELALVRRSLGLPPS